MSMSRPEPGSATAHHSSPEGVQASSRVTAMTRIQSVSNSTTARPAQTGESTAPRARRSPRECVSGRRDRARRAQSASSLGTPPGLPTPAWVPSEVDDRLEPGVHAARAVSPPRRPTHGACVACSSRVGPVSSMLPPAPVPSDQVAAAVTSASEPSDHSPVNAPSPARPRWTRSVDGFGAQDSAVAAGPSGPSPRTRFRAAVPSPPGPVSADPESSCAGPSSLGNASVLQAKTSDSTQTVETAPQGPPAWPPAYTQTPSGARVGVGSQPRLRDSGRSGGAAGSAKGSPEQRRHAQPARTARTRGVEACGGSRGCADSAEGSSARGPCPGPGFPLDALGLHREVGPEDVVSPRPGFTRSGGGEGQAPLPRAQWAVPRRFGASGGEGKGML